METQLWINLVYMPCNKPSGVDNMLIVAMPYENKGFHHDSTVDTFQDFLIAEHMKPRMHILEMSIPLIFITDKNLSNLLYSTALCHKTTSNGSK